MRAIQRATGDWTELRKLPGVREVDLHFAQGGAPIGPSSNFAGKMAAVRQHVLQQIVAASQDEAVAFLLVVHGKSTSRPGRTSSRSVVRDLARDKAVTPYIDRAKCVQHESCFAFALRRENERGES
jgi:hypothetical protein